MSGESNASHASYADLAKSLRLALTIHNEAAEKLHEPLKLTSKAARELRFAISMRRLPIISINKQIDALGAIGSSYRNIRKAAEMLLESETGFQDTEKVFKHIFKGTNDPAVQDEIITPITGQGFLFKSMGEVLIDSIGDSIVHTQGDASSEQLESAAGMLESCSETMTEVMQNFMGVEIGVRGYMGRQGMSDG